MPVQAALSLTSGMDGSKRVESTLRILDNILYATFDIPNAAIKIDLNKFWRRGLLGNEKNFSSHCQNSKRVLGIRNIKRKTSNIEMVILYYQTDDSEILGAKVQPWSQKPGCSWKTRSNRQCTPSCYPPRSNYTEPHLERYPIRD